MVFLNVSRNLGNKKTLMSWLLDEIMWLNVLCGLFLWSWWWTTGSYHDKFFTQKNRKETLRKSWSISVSRAQKKGGEKARTWINGLLHKSFFGYVLPLTAWGDVHKGGGEVWMMWVLTLRTQQPPSELCHKRDKPGARFPPLPLSNKAVTGHGGAHV